MIRYLIALALTAPAAVAHALAPTETSSMSAAGAQAFLDVARVLQSPRCRNCHPSGDRPLQGDAGRPHAMNISRMSVDMGLTCRACHMETNSDEMGIIGGPPGAPHWGLPPVETPMVFEGLTPAALCAQLNDPSKTGGRDRAALLAHVRDDLLVLWGWKPGGGRALPPLDHATFVQRFETWVRSGGACPTP